MIIIMMAALNDLNHCLEAINAVASEEERLSSPNDDQFVKVCKVLASTADVLEEELRRKVLSQESAVSI